MPSNPSRPPLRFSLAGLLMAVVAIAIPLAFARWLYVNRPLGQRDVQCANNLKNIGLAILNYSYTFNVLPVAKPPPNPAHSGPRASWYSQIAPFLDMQGPYVLDAYGDPMPVQQGNHFLLQCPMNPQSLDASGRGLTHYAGISGLGADSARLPSGHPRAGVFGYNRLVRLRDIKDGASQTMMLAEVSTGLGAWALAGPHLIRAVDPSTKPYIGRNRPFGGNHRRGAWVALADGSVRYITESANPRVLEALSTIAGGERIPTPK